MAQPLPTADVCLLSLDRCRALLPADCNLNDMELERLRDGLYALAGAAVNGFLVQRPVMRQEETTTLKFSDRKGER